MLTSGVPVVYLSNINIRFSYIFSLKKNKKNEKGFYLSLDKIKVGTAGKLCWLKISTESI